MVAPGSATHDVGGGELDGDIVAIDTGTDTALG